MSDGSVFDVDLRWAADGTVEKFGNSGPYSGDVPTHFRDPCTTAHSVDHQKFVHTDVTGTIGGIDIGSFGYRDSGIYGEWIHWMVVTHGNCTG